MKKIITKIENFVYTDGKFNAVNSFILGFVSLGALLAFLLLLQFTIFKDSQRRIDRIDEQIQKSRVLYKNIDDFFYFTPGKILYSIELKEQYYEVWLIEMGNDRQAIIEFWYKGKEYDWQFDSLKLIKQSDTYISEPWKYIELRYDTEN